VNLLLSRAHHPVTVLGYGRRVGIWTQGCRIRCAGCVSRDTWAADPQAAVDDTELLDWIRSLPEDEVDGITISGGEPFDQPAALEHLLDGLLSWRRQRTRPADLLCYSGYPLRRLRARHGPILNRLDVLIPEPFRAANTTAPPMRGSSNQPMVLLTPLAEERYGASFALDVDKVPRLQVEVDNEAIWYIGVPRPGDMDRLQELMERRGVRQEQVSWRS